MSLEDADNLPYDDAVLMWEMYQKGMAGPSVNYMNGYNTYAMLHSLREVTIATNSKGYKQQPPESFESVFNTQYRIMASKGEAKKLSIGAQSIVALGSSGAPAWLVEAAQSELNEVNDNGSRGN